MQIGNIFQTKIFFSSFLGGPGEKERIVFVGRGMKDYILPGFKIARKTLQGTLHFNINLGLKVSLDPPEKEFVKLVGRRPSY